MRFLRALALLRRLVVATEATATALTRVGLLVALDLHARGIPTEPVRGDLLKSLGLWDPQVEDVPAANPDAEVGWTDLDYARAEQLEAAERRLRRPLDPDDVEALEREMAATMAGVPSRVADARSAGRRWTSTQGTALPFIP